MIVVWGYYFLGLLVELVLIVVNCMYILALLVLQCIQ
jgi:hypothetical protein